MQVSPRDKLVFVIVVVLATLGGYYLSAHPRAVLPTIIVLSSFLGTIVVVLILRGLFLRLLGFRSFECSLLVYPRFGDEVLMKIVPAMGGLMPPLQKLGLRQSPERSAEALVSRLITESQSKRRPIVGTRAEIRWYGDRVIYLELFLDEPAFIALVDSGNYKRMSIASATSPSSNVAPIARAGLIKLIQENATAFCRKRLPLSMYRSHDRSYIVVRRIRGDTQRVPAI
jgi:hypothetical protein